MKIAYDLTVVPEVAEKFKIALRLDDENSDEVIENFMLKYISTSFAKAVKNPKLMKKLKSLKDIETIKNELPKAIIRIPKWAMSPNQTNHKIIKAYFEVENEMGCVSLEELKRRCGDEDKYPGTYVKDFKGNFYQMKTDAYKSHGKVFELEMDNVVIWKEIEEKLMEYKKYFERI
ncbi:hypothetical protein [Acetobacterium sp.]|uniref:hypothetical protein n=1 Tax=Acetobacterium sp. TaxID=1872094 RepID=UPI002F40B13D